MQYTIEQVIAEVANARERGLRADKALQKALDNYSSAEDPSRYEDEYDLAETATITSGLYLSCLSEMAVKIVTPKLYEVWTEPAFLQKWEGTPFRYKRLLNALERRALEVLPEGSSIEIYTYNHEPWVLPHITIDIPVLSGTEGNHPVFVDSYMPLVLAPLEDDGHRVFRLDTRESAPASPDFSSFADITDACDGVFAIKRKRDKILDDAIRAARELATERSLGLSELRGAIESRHYEF